MKIERIFTQDDYNRFARLSGDFNPIHVDEEFSKRSGFRKTVAHGIFLMTCLSGALEKEIGAFEFIATKIMFPAPTFTNVEMIISAQIISENEGEIIAQLKTYEKHSGQETCVIDAIIKNSFNTELHSKKNSTPCVIEPDFKTQKPFKIGQSFGQTRVFCQNDIDEFTALGGHKNIDDQISPIFINGMFSKLLGIDLPGLGTNYLKQETQYLNPAFFGEKITANIKITRIREDKKIIDFETTAKNEDGKIIATGRALVSARDVIGAF